MPRRKIKLMLDLDSLTFSGVTLSDFSVRVLLLLTVIGLDKFVSLPNSYHPKLFFKYFALQLANKVNKHSIAQQKIAGQLTLLLLISLALGLTWVILFFAIYPWFFQFIILSIIITSKPLLDCTKTIKSSLKKNHKVLAREQLQQLCFRDTNNLSPIGITKATIEALPQRLIICYYSPILIFACLGIYPTVFAITISAIAQQYNPKHLRYRHFGAPAIYLSHIISFPTLLVVALNIYLLFGAQTSAKNFIKQAKQWHSFSNGFLLTAVGWALNCSLGGAVKYQGIKIRRPQLGATMEPSIENIDDIKRVSHQVTSTWLGMLLLALTTSIIVSVIFN